MEKGGLCTLGGLSEEGVVIGAFLGSGPAMEPKMGAIHTSIGG